MNIKRGRTGTLLKCFARMDGRWIVRLMSLLKAVTMAFSHDTGEIGKTPLSQVILV